MLKQFDDAPRIDEINSLTEKDRKKLFKKAFGYFDNGIYTMMNNKFKKLFE